MQRWRSKNCWDSVSLAWWAWYSIHHLLSRTHSSRSQRRVEQIYFASMISPGWAERWYSVMNHLKITLNPPLLRDTSFAKEIPLELVPYDLQHEYSSELRKCITDARNGIRTFFRNPLLLRQILCEVFNLVNRFELPSWALFPERKTWMKVKTSSMNPLSWMVGYILQHFQHP